MKPQLATAKKILVHIHVFYPEFIADMARCLNNLQSVAGGSNVDAWVTVPEGGKNLEKAVRHSFPSAEIVVVPNKGYDIAPFLRVLSRVDLDEYDCVVKLHTKRNKNEYHFFGFIRGAQWRMRLLSFCWTESKARRTVKAFAAHPKLGMVVGRKEFDPSGVGVYGDLTIGDDILGKIGLVRNRNDAVYGTMFAMRAELLKPFLKLKDEEFPELNRDDPHQIPKVALDCEWAFPRSVSAQGYMVLPVDFPVAIELIIRDVRACLLKAIRFVVDRVALHRMKPHLVR